MSNESVCVFVGAAFPGVVRVGEVDRHVGGGLDRAIAVELGAVVGGDGVEGSRGVTNELDGSPVERSDGAVSELADQNEAGGALNKRNDAVLCAGADDGINFPVANLAA